MIFTRNCSSCMKASKPSARYKLSQHTQIKMKVTDKSLFPSNYLTVLIKICRILSFIAFSSYCQRGITITNVVNWDKLLQFCAAIESLNSQSDDMPIIRIVQFHSSNYRMENGWHFWHNRKVSSRENDKRKQGMSWTYASIEICLNWRVFRACDFGSSVKRLISIKCFRHIYTIPPKYKSDQTQSSPTCHKRPAKKQQHEENGKIDRHNNNATTEQLQFNANEITRSIYLDFSQFLFPVVHHFDCCYSSCAVMLSLVMYCDCRANHRK